MSVIVWLLDPAHSEITFKVKHLMIATVTGRFKSFYVRVETQTEDFNTASLISFSANTDTLDTNNEQRDNHLKSADFFDIKNYRELAFFANKYESMQEEAKVFGDLTIKDTTRPVLLKILFGGVAIDSYGQTKAGFTIETSISRKDYGLTWNSLTEAGGVIVGDEIKIYGDIQLVKQV
ncbi:MAG: YceI family protein [Ferruginibacter sp.]